MDAGTAPQVLTYSEMFIKNIQDIQHKTQRSGHEESTFFPLYENGNSAAGQSADTPQLPTSLIPPLPVLNFNKLDL